MDKETLQEMILQQLIENVFGDYVQDDVILVDLDEVETSELEDLDECIVTC